MRRIITRGFCSGLMLAAAVLLPGADQAEGTMPIASVAAGESATCSVTVEGGVWCWGKPFGVRSAVPTPLAGLESGVGAVEVGFNHLCALTTEGGVRCLGLGFLGDGSYTYSVEPVDVVNLDEGAVSVSTLWEHTCALTQLGGIKCWGPNDEGQLGDETNAYRDTPGEVVGFQAGAEGVSVGFRHTCGLIVLGLVQCWGSNRYGQLGDGTTEDRNTPVLVLDSQGAALTNVVSVEVGYLNSCAVTESGGVKCWGLIHEPALGDFRGGDFPFRTVAAAVPELASGVAAVSPGALHTCALMYAGSVKCWGSDFYGQLGDGDVSPRSGGPHPVDVVGLGGSVDAISAGGYHTCAISASNVKCWGDNTFGTLGDGTTEDSPVPVDVLFDADSDGCADGREAGPAALLGGQRNPKSFWDFFDTPDEANERDRAVTATDLARVVARFGAVGNADIDALSTPDPAPAYHPAFDRSPPAKGADVWDAGPPDGSIGAGDVAAVVAQFGHTCA